MAMILITGGAGNIGSRLAMLLDKNPNNHIVILDNLLTGIRAHIPNQKTSRLLRQMLINVSM